MAIIYGTRGLGGACHRHRHAAGDRRRAMAFSGWAQAPAATPFPFPWRCWAPAIWWAFRSASPWLLGIAIAWAGAVPLITAMTPDHGVALGDFVTTHLAHPGAFHRRRRHGGGGDLVPGPHHGADPGRPEGSAGANASWRWAIGDQTDRDISFNWMVALTVAATALSDLLVWRFASDAGLGGNALGIAALSIPIMLVFGFIVAAICGYMAGLIGSSNSPISGVGILAVVGCSASCW